MSQPTDHRDFILYDGDCPLCLKSLSWLKRFDWRHAFRFINVRNEAERQAVPVELQMDKLVAEMHVVTATGEKIFVGFRAIRRILWQLPPLCWLTPFLYIPGIPKLGQWVYLWIARNRFHLVPCHDGVCAMPPKSKKKNVA